MQVLAFRHVPHEPLGYFEQFFAEKKIPFAYVDLFQTNEVPRRIEATHLVFLGGPMSVNDEREFSWLRQEKELIRKSAKTGQKVLGICLGAQLIASANGAPVYPFVHETGWQELDRAGGDAGAFSAFPARFRVFQLHGETFAIPYGGRLLASGRNVRNQAFSCKNALGLQFHLELTGEIIRDWSRGLRRVERERIGRETPRYLTESNRLGRIIAAGFTVR